MKLSKKRMGRRLKYVRLNHNMTQEKMAKRCTISRSFLADLERGAREMSLHTLAKILCRFPTVSAEYLLGF